MSEHKNDLHTGRFWLQRSSSQSKFALKHVNHTESLLLFVLPPPDLNKQLDLYYIPALN